MVVRRKKMKRRTILIALRAVVIESVGEKISLAERSLAYYAISITACFSSLVTSHQLLRTKKKTPMHTHGRSYSGAGNRI